MHQLRLVVYPIIYKILCIPGGDLRISEPSTVGIPYITKVVASWWLFQVPPHPGGLRPPSKLGSKYYCAKTWMPGAWFGSMVSTLPETNSVYAPEKLAILKGNEKVFQASIFSVREGTCLGYWEV